MQPRLPLRPWASALTRPFKSTSPFVINPSLPTKPSPAILSLSVRSFSASPNSQSWLAPRRGHKGKSRDGRPRVRTGGSMRGTSMVWGDFGLRMCDHDRRVSAAQLQVGWETIRRRLRGLKFRMIPRVAADRAVFTSGNEMRMGKGKGSFDYYASRIAVNHMIFELRGDIHEKIVRDAFRLAAAKMPGQYEFVKKGDPPVMGLTKVMQGMTLESIARPWLVGETPMSGPPPPLAASESRTPPTPKEPLEATADRLPAASP